MYVEGCPTVDNPPTIANGLVQLNLPWAPDLARLDR
jgi:hypothetical protein